MPEPKIMIDLSGDLSRAEIKAVLLMRELLPYQKIEIKLLDNKPGIISIVRNETLREDFPIDTQL